MLEVRFLTTTKFFIWKTLQWPNLLNFITLISYDVRGKSLSEATTWSDQGVFGPRAKFITQSDPAFLEIDVS